MCKKTPRTASSNQTNSIPGIKGHNIQDDQKKHRRLSASDPHVARRVNEYCRGPAGVQCPCLARPSRRRAAHAGMQVSGRSGEQGQDGRKKKKDRRGKETRHLGGRSVVGAPETLERTFPALLGARAWCREQVYRVVKLVCKGVSGFVVAVVGSRRRHGRAGRVRGRAGCCTKQDDGRT